MASNIFDSGPFDPNADLGPLLQRVCVAMICISGLAVIGRFYIRYLMRQPIKWDDWMILIALPLCWGCCIVEMIGIDTAVFGRHAQFATKGTTLNYFKLLYALQIIYPLSIVPIKLSIILFYRRIFAIQQTKIPCAIVGLLVVFWGIGATLPSIFACIPIDTFWTMPEAGPRCINTLLYYLGIAIANSITDLILLLLPLPWIWKLFMPPSQKIALTGIFMLGGFIIVVSALCLATVIQTQGQLDFTWSLIPLAIWNVIETNVGVLLACLPSMRPLLRLALGQKLEGRHGGAAHRGGYDGKNVNTTKRSLSGSGSGSRMWPSWMKLSSSSASTWHRGRGGRGGGSAEDDTYQFRDDEGHQGT